MKGGQPGSTVTPQCNGGHVPEPMVTFSEGEVAQILWALAESLEMAEHLDALSTLVLIEDTFAMVRARFDQRGRE